MKEITVLDSIIGKNSIELRHLLVKVLSDDAYTTGIIDPDISFEIRDINFYSNNVLRSISIHVFTEFKGVDAKILLKPCLVGFGLVPVTSNDQVARLLAPVFPSESVSFFRRDSIRPNRIGAVISTKDAEFLFLFSIRMGALQSPVLPEEFLRSIKIL